MKTEVLENLQADLVAVEAQIVAANAAMLEASGQSIASFEIDTGEADQKVIFRRIESLTKTLDILRRQRDYLVSRITGCAIVSVRVRRKP